MEIRTDNPQPQQERCPCAFARIGLQLNVAVCCRQHANKLAEALSNVIEDFRDDKAGEKYVPGFESHEVLVVFRDQGQADDFLLRCRALAPNVIEQGGLAVGYGPGADRMLERARGVVEARKKARQ